MMTTTEMKITEREHQPAPKRYSKEYFEQVISDLRDSLKAQLPTVDPQARQTFHITCESFQEAKDARDKAQALLDALRKNKAEDTVIEQAKEALEATQNVFDMTSKLCLQVADPILESLDLDESTLDEAKLLQCTVLVQSTPEALAAFCAEDDPSNGQLLDRHLADTAFLRAILLNGGASNGLYHRAFYIYDQLVQCDNLLSFLYYQQGPHRHVESKERSSSTSSDLRHRLALAVALELCQPHLHFHSKTLVVDPNSRHWHYATAFDKGELDDAFETLSIWELRMVIDCDCHDEELQWGRDYLRNYRPDEVLLKDEQWRYCRSVRTDLGYRQSDHPFDTYPAMLSAGGECGPRAFFGRFICKAFGIPTWGVRQPGHAAMSRWTSEGWKICLGADFKFSSWQDNRFGNKGSRSGLDFQVETKAREATNEDIFYSNMTRLECVAESVADERVEQEVRPEKFWRSLSLMQRRKLAQNKDMISVSSGSYSGEGKKNENGPVGHVKQNHDGSRIIIPATAFSSPIKPSDDVMVTPSFLEGGEQLHLEHNGSVIYSLPKILPNQIYSLSCRYVTVHEVQRPLLLSIECPDENMASIVALDDSTHIDIEYTVGYWKSSEPVQVSLGGGATISISREGDCHGLSIKDFVLVPCSSGEAR